MKTIGFVSVAVVALILLGCGSKGPAVCSLDGGQPLQTSDWPKFRADIGNTGQSSADLSGFDTSNPDLDLVWRVVTGSSVISSPAIGTAHEIYIGSSDSRAYKIEALPSMTCTAPQFAPCGTIDWQVPTNNTITSGPAIDHGNTIYFASNDGFLYTFMTDGTDARSPFNVSGALGSPNVAPSPNAGVAYVSSQMTGLFAVCPNDIARWTSQLVPISSTAAIGADGTVFTVATSLARTVLSLNGGNGLQNWIFTATASINASPIITAPPTPGSLTGQILYVVDSLGRLFGINATTGVSISSSGALFDLQMQNPNAQVFASPALGKDGTIYIADTTGTLWAITIDPTTSPPNVKATSRVVFQIPSKMQILSSPVVTAANGGLGQTLIFGADDGVLYVVEDSGEEATAPLWMYSTMLNAVSGSPCKGGPIQSSPALAKDGTIYVGSNDNCVYALRPPTPPAEPSPTPTPTPE